MFVKITIKAVKKVYNKEVEIFEPIIINCDGIKAIRYSAKRDLTTITYTHDTEPIFIRGDIAQRIIDVGLPDVKDGGIIMIADNEENNQGGY